MTKKIIKLCLLSVTIISTFCFNNDVLADCSGCNQTVGQWDENANNAGAGAKGKCITGSMCQNQNVIILQTEIAHINNSGKKVYDTVYWTNNPAYAGGKVIYADWMTKKSYDYGTAADQLANYLSSNNYAATKELLAKAGITNFKGSINGKDAYGLISQAMIQYKDPNGKLAWKTLKDYAATNPTNRKRALEYLALIATGNDSLLQYIKGMTSGQCAGSSLAIAASPASGCGLNIIDIAELCKLLGIVPELKPPKCPSGDMKKSGGISECYPSKGGNSFGFSYSATGGGRGDVHMQYGEEKGQTGSDFCKLYCQENGTATLPGATGEALNLGSYIIWPTSEFKFNEKYQKDYYPLKFSGELYCRLGVKPDPNMPGTNGECFHDPVKEYDDSWKIVNQLWNQKDFTGKKTFEQVRKEYFGRTHNPSAASGLCKANYNNGGESCENDAGADYFLGKKFKRCVGQPLETEAVPYVAKILQERKKAMDTAVNAYNAIGCSEDEMEDVCNHYNNAGKCDGGTHKQLTACAVSKRAAKATMNAAIAAYKEAESEQKRLNQLIQDIKDTINNCKAYVEAFEKDCVILADMRKCGIFTIDESIYDFRSSVDFSWNDAEYYTGLSVNKTNSSKSVKNSATVEIPDGDAIDDVDSLLIYPAYPNFQGDVFKIKEREFSVNAEDVYSLESQYQYVNKDSLKYTKNPPSNANYVDIKMGIVPTSYKNEVGNKSNYYLTLSNISFGSSNANFGDGALYACKQEFTKGSDLCVCPENTPKAGLSLTGALLDSDMTCLDAQNKYCDGSETPPPGDVPYCPAPDDNISLGPCVNAGYKVSECKSKLCGLDSKKLKCKNTNGVGGHMDITACVEIKMMQLGVNQQKAIDICDKLICPDGKNIIYRTIRLESPFPGKEAKSLVDGFNTDPFNSTHSGIGGRWPGYNWNSRTVVKKKIINNRGYTGNDIYQQAKPLYTFVLNGATIDRIRNYNASRNNGYNDFKKSSGAGGGASFSGINCKLNGSAACVSDFIHFGNYGFVGGECAGHTSKDSFYKCASR